MSERKLSDNNEEDNKRKEMTEYWNQDHCAPTLENMMLDSKAAEMDRHERPEILAALPPFRGKQVLELGAGIGRFSTILAGNAAKVVALDFVQASCDANLKSNAELVEAGRLEVICADATKYNAEPEAFDLVFINWLLMYFADDEVNKFARRAIDWLKLGGSLYFRESCFHQSGNAARKTNPTRYRHPKQYFDIFSQAVGRDGSRLMLKKTSCVDTYARFKDNVNQVWWLFEKVGPANDRVIDYLSREQYSYHNVLRYERVYGAGFMSPGGEKFTGMLAKELGMGEVDLATGSFEPTPQDSGATANLSVPRVLDVGCGLGGNTLFLADKCKAFVHGIDLSGAMIQMQMLRWNQIRDRSTRERVSFETTDVFEWNPPPNSFTSIIMREFFMHISVVEKAVLLKRLSRWLLPGGQLAIVDYCAGKDEGAQSDEFKKYVADRKYHLLTQKEQEAVIGDHFEIVRVQDHTNLFASFMSEEEARIEECFGPRKSGQPVYTFSPIGHRPLVSSETPPLDLGESAQGESAASVEKVEKVPDDREELIIKIFERISGIFNREFGSALPVGVAEQAANAALNEVTKAFKESDQDDEIRAEDYAWCKNSWALKRRLVASGDLKWITYVAKRPNLS